MRLCNAVSSCRHSAPRNGVECSPCLGSTTERYVTLQSAWHVSTQSSCETRRTTSFGIVNKVDIARNQWGVQSRFAPKSTLYAVRGIAKTMPQ